MPSDMMDMKMVQCDCGFMICSHNVFFFQAEDGIRDYKVTGVQTCALPIFDQQSTYTRSPYIEETSVPNRRRRRLSTAMSAVAALAVASPAAVIAVSDLSASKIGRASCRERV